MGCARDQGAAVRHGAGPLLGVDDGDIRSLSLTLQGGLLQRHAHAAASAGHRGHHVAGVRQDPALQLDGKAVQLVPVVAGEGAEHGGRRRVAGAGHSGVRQRDGAGPPAA